MANEPSPLTFGFYYDPATEQVDDKRQLSYADERHILLFGLNGAGKSTRILIENLVKAQNRNLVVLDVKGELAAQTARARRQFSDVKIVDPFGVSGLPSDGFNPLLRLDPASSSFSDDAAALAEAMVETEAKDPHWSESARGLLAALIMWEVMQAQRAQRWPSLFNVRMTLTEPDGKNSDGQIISGFTLTIRQMVEQGGDKITSLVGRFMREGGRNELASIQSTAITQTEWLLSDAMRADIEARGGVEFAQLRKRPTTVYICLPPDEISRMRRWTRTVIVSALRELFRPSPLKTLFVLDEYYVALGKLSIIEDVWSVVRGYGIQLMPILQSATQLKNLYGEAWENFGTQAGAIITIGPPGDLLTAKWMSERSGTTTAWQESHNTGEQQNPGGIGMSEGSSRQQFARPFLLPQELMDMPAGTGRMWLPGMGSKSIPFYAPNYWQRRAIAPLVGENPYHRGGDSLPPASVAAEFATAFREKLRQMRSPYWWLKELRSFVIWTVGLAVGIIVLGFVLGFLSGLITVALHALQPVPSSVEQHHKQKHSAKSE